MAGSLDSAVPRGHSADAGRESTGGDNAGVGALVLHAGVVLSPPWVEVVLLAAAFDPDGPQEPAGWIKQVGTERRACGWLVKSARREHAGFIPECPDCGDETLI